MVEAFRPYYPFESRYFDVGRGLRMHYLDEGRGEPVVMVHGNPSWSFYFRNLLNDLRHDHRVIVPDHIGMGLSDKPGAKDYEFTFERRVADLDALLEQLGPNGVSLIVHDWGGAIGLAWAVRHPERIRRIVVLNTGAFLLPKGKRLPWQLKLARTPLGPLLIQGFNAFALGAARSCCTQRPMPAELRRAYVAPYNSWKNRLAVLRFVQDIPLSPDHPSYAPLKKLGEDIAMLKDKPMMLGWGGRDFVFDDDFLVEWIRRFPRAEIYRYPDAGHYVLEDAAANLIPAIRFFLARDQVLTP